MICIDLCAWSRLTQLADLTVGNMTLTMPKGELAIPLDQLDAGLFGLGCYLVGPFACNMLLHKIAFPHTNQSVALFAQAAATRNLIESVGLTG